MSLKPLTRNSSQTYSRQEALNYFIENGNPLIELRGKTPLAKQWQKTEADPLLLPTDIKGNYGIVIRNDEMVIDWDPRKIQTDKGHTETLSNLCKRFEWDYDNTVLVMTGRGDGGKHIWTKKPPDIKINKHHPDFPELEFLTRGHFVVGPGCIHPDTGGIYEAVRLGLMKEAPSGLIDLLSTPIFAQSSIDDFHDDEGTADRFKRFLANHPGAIEGQDGDPTTLKVALRGRDMGLSKMYVYNLMLVEWNDKCQPPWDPEDLLQKVENAFDYGKHPIGNSSPVAAFKDVEVCALDTKTEKAIAPSVYKTGPNAEKPIINDLENTVFYLLLPSFPGGKYHNPLHGMYWMNLMSNKIEYRKAAPWHKNGIMARYWTDGEAIHLKYHLSSRLFYKTTIENCHHAAFKAACENPYHPVKEYLAGLIWDGVERLDRLLIDYAGADDNPYVRNVGKNTIIAAVARVMKPGCQHDHILVLEGKQGTGKSSFCRILGGEWYADITIDAHNKDTIDAIQGKLLIEVSEMECAKRTETQALKAFLSRTDDTVRPAYARASVVFPRQCIFIGTINPENDGAYLKDTTGNRRFWPVETNAFRLEALARDRDQLFAEAYHRYLAGEMWYIDDKAIEKLAIEEQTRREHEDAWAEIIKNWIDRTPDLPNILSGTQIAQDAMQIPSKFIGRIELVRIAKCMEKLGFEKGKFYNRLTGGTLNGFRHKSIDWELLVDL